MAENNEHPQGKIQQKIEGGEITLTINNPPLNILSIDTLRELGELLDAIKENQKIKAVVITGSGKHFSAGADIKEIKEIVFGKNPYEKGWKFAGIGLAAMVKIYEFSKPVTAIINGTCLGGGMELALACRRRVAVSHAILGFPETTIGLIPGWGGLEFIRNLESFPEKKLEITEVVSKGLYLTTEEALELGLVDEIINSGEEPKKPASRPYSVKAAKYISHSLNNRESPKLKQQNRLSLDVMDFAKLCSLDSAKEGVEAFLDKRLPSQKYGYRLD